MHQSIYVRPLREDDLPRAAQIELETAESWNIEALKAELSALSGRCFALCQDETLVGLALWQLAADEASLLKISVSAGRRQRGLGAFFLQEMIRLLKTQGAARFFLEVRQGNTPAVALYQKCGFQQAGMRRGFYRNPPEDALVMNREES